MKKKTSNAERRTSNGGVRCGRVREATSEDYHSISRRPTFDLEDRLLRFSAAIVRLADSLPNTKAGNHIAGQLLRCGTSTLANHGEVESAESRRDFLHKLRICLKELRETGRWLRLIAILELADEKRLRASLIETEELTRIFVASVRTTERNSK